MPHPGAGEPPSRVYLSLRELPARHYPAVVHRRGPRTLLINDPRASRFDLTERNVDLLTEAEANVVRRAFGCPPVGQALPCSMLDGPAYLYVPPELRLPGEQPLQGGQELLRRYEAGDLGDALERSAAEIVQDAESA